MSDPLAEERLAEAWTTGGRGEGCPGDDVFWEAAGGTLTPAEVERLLDHTASCPTCALALSTAAAVRGEAGLPEPAAHRSWWDVLTRSVLRPEAALAYLLLLALTVPLLWRGRAPAPMPGPAAAPAQPASEFPRLRAAREIGLETEPVSRGGAAAEPVMLEGEGVVVLRLFVEPEDLHGGESLEVRLTSPRGALLTDRRPVDAPEHTLNVVLEPAALPRGVPLQLDVRAGSRLVFRRTLIVGG